MQDLIFAISNRYLLSDFIHFFLGAGGIVQIADVPTFIGPHALLSQTRQPCLDLILGIVRKFNFPLVNELLQ